MDDRPAFRHPPHALGAWGESEAARRLQRAGYTVLERNYRLGRREVDLIACRGSVLAFVEVKTRAGRGWGGPEHAVTARKRREIEVVATSYLLRHRRPEPDVRFDVVAIEVDGARVVRFTHHEDAWRARDPRLPCP